MCIKVIDQKDIRARNPVDLLRELGKPSCIKIPGKDSSRCRFVVTLLHGNEPSGVKAMAQWLSSNEQPLVDMYFVIMNIEAALQEPLFSHRHLPEKKDLNRCFAMPFTGEEGNLAKDLIELIHSKKPEALIDIHNTSGSGPAFGVAIYLDSKHDALVSLFTERLIITDLRLGALMELSEQDVPTVTIECGGVEDPASQQLALEGLQRFCQVVDPFDMSEAPWPIEVLHNPVRFELSEDTRLSYADAPDPQADLTLINTIEHFNFGQVTADTVLGWVNSHSNAAMKIKSGKGYQDFSEWFQIIDGVLKPARNLKLFMITSRADIALSDCLLYAVRSN